jgi:hypothetical protein
LTGLINAQGAVHDDIRATRETMTYLDNASSNVDAILDAVLGNGGQARSDFDNVYNAYTKGQYHNQKALNKSDAYTAYTDALVLVENFTATGNMTTDLEQLRVRMETAINTAMGVGGMKDANATKVRALNGYLIKQIAEDGAQLQAFADDVITEKGYNGSAVFGLNSTVGAYIDYEGNPYAPTTTV